MMQRQTFWYHYVALGAAIAVGAIFLYLVRSILPPFIIGFAIAWLLTPLLNLLRARGCPKPLAVIGVYCLFLAFFVGGLIYLIPTLIDQANELARDFPTYTNRVSDFATEFMESHHSTLARLHLPTTRQEALSQYGTQATEAVGIGVRHLSKWVVANLSVALWLILVPLSAFYFLNDMDRMGKKAPLLIPQQWRQQTTEMLSRMGQVFSNYLRGLGLVCLLFGLSSTLVLSIFQFKYSITLGIVSGLLYAVPYIGCIVTTALIIVAGLATGAFHPIWVALGLVILNQIFDFLIRPKVLGDSVGLHPVLSLFALLAGGHLFGLVGMLLAVPVAASVQEIVFEFYPELRPAPKEEKPKPPRLRKLRGKPAK